MTPSQAPALHELITYIETADAEWQPIGPGARRRTLHSDDHGQRVLMVQWDAGYELPYRDEHHHDEFLYIVEGDFVDQHRSCGPGTFVHNRPGSWHQPHTTGGVTFLAFISPTRAGQA